MGSSNGLIHDAHANGMHASSLSESTIAGDQLPAPPVEMLPRMLALVSLRKLTTSRFRFAPLTSQSQRSGQERGRARAGETCFQALDASYVLSSREHPWPWQFTHASTPHLIPSRGAALLPFLTRLIPDSKCFVCLSCSRHPLSEPTANYKVPPLTVVISALSSPFSSRPSTPCYSARCLSPKLRICGFVVTKSTKYLNYCTRTLGIGWNRPGSW
ncbi:hypothetical protein DM02DRAFT_347842 [Periconia macrospinosa]|uniref:Uncharacterized protein n=1 Tax=Periconia macrospinosa TaxID=97972 RepID=A0A2V1DSU9_9PLEO|nr:hypothetical protein DM02DRAFT_347842 [Periconia macrospinosa]